MVSNRLKADARAHMEQHPGISYQQALRAVTTVTSRPATWDAVLRDIDEIVGQEGVKEQLRTILNLAVVRTEYRRRGLLFPDSSKRGKQNFLITGGFGTGKSHVVRVLARLLCAAGAIETAEVMTVGRHDLVGTTPGEAEKKVAAVFDAARGGVLEVIDMVANPADVVGRAGLYTLARQINNDRVGDDQDGPVVVLTGRQNAVRQLLEQEPATAGLFDLHVELAAPAAQDLWEYLGRRVRQPEGHGFVIDPDAEEPFVAIVEKLKTQSSPIGSALDSLANLRFVHITIDCAYHQRVRKLRGVADLSALTDEELFTLTPEDVVAAASMAARFSKAAIV